MYGSTVAELREAGRMDDQTVGSTTITDDGVTIHYDTRGSGADVVLIHGLTDRSATWGPVADMLAARYRVTTLDLRGHGQSGDAPVDASGAHGYRAIGMARDVTAVVAAAAIENPLVIGHSLGGIVATAYVAGAQVRGAINVDQTLQLSAFQEGLRQVKPLLRHPASFPEILAAIFGSMDGDVLSADIRSEIAALRHPRQEVVLGVWGEVLDTEVTVLDARMADVASTITAPYLSLEFVDANPHYKSWLQAMLPHAVLENWPGLGHYGHRVDPERFVQRVVDFDI